MNCFICEVESSSPLCDECAENPPEIFDENPVFFTQQGGLVRMYSNGSLRFLSPPRNSGLKAGDRMPKTWPLVPANFQALVLIAG